MTEKTLKIIEQKQINKMNNDIHSIRIEYDHIWFDYQALFDQKKKLVLPYDFKIKEFETIPVQHTDLEKNTFAKKALFEDKVNYNFINDICTGFAPTIIKALFNLFEYMNKNFFSHNWRTSSKCHIILGSWWKYVHNFHMVKTIWFTKAI